MNSPAALAHAHDLARPQERDQLAEDDLQPVGVVAQGLHADLEPGHVAVVVGAPDVDEAVEAPLELVAVVGDVAQQVGGVAARLDQDLVLGQAEGGGPQPDGAVGLVGVAAGHQVGQGGLDRPRRHHRALAEPGVEADVDPRQRAPEVGQHPLLAPLAGVGVGRHLRRPVGHVLALVAVLRHRPALAGGRPATR